LLPNYWECEGRRVGEVLLGLDATDLDRTIAPED